ncbi:MAG: hypothetical protein FWF09_03945 [Bacteroidales bacterium]|nr:hypothetical protein [Bacteroidales bacterium]
MKTQHFLIVLAAVAVLVTACKKDEKPQVKKEVFSGYAQKGPFVNGSSVTVVELNENLNQTGRTYHAAISDNSGNFNQNGIELVSRYVELKADGFYFNEISGQTSGASMTLYTLADIEDVSSVNVNVLTHLEKQRVEYLAKQEKKNFSAAKQQAQQEVLAIFGFEPIETSSEVLNLTNDAILLAISCILQGYLSTGDVTELMANIIADIKEDGKLDNIDLGSKLMNNAYSISLSLSTVRNNLTKKYSELGINVTIPDFESYIEAFINSKLYPLTVSITYPATGASGDNILSEYVTEVTTLRGPEYNYSMKADVPEGMSLKIVLKGGFYASWYYSNTPPPINWTVNFPDYDSETQIFIQTFTVTEGGKPNDLAIQAYDPIGLDGQTQITDQSYIMVEYYENGSVTPTKTKTMKVISSY